MPTCDQPSSSSQPACVRLVGLDRSPQMLAAERRKVPDARFVEADIPTGGFGEHFDIVICVFDTLNHLVSFDACCQRFERARAHQRDDGVPLATIGDARAGEFVLLESSDDAGTPASDESTRAYSASRARG